jgi:hypothetical protein
VPNLCGCTPNPDPCGFYECGTAPDGCGGFVACGGGCCPGYICLNHICKCKVQPCF